MAQREVTIKVTIDEYESITGNARLEPTTAQIVTDLTKAIERVATGQIRYNRIDVNTVKVGDQIFGEELVDELDEEEAKQDGNLEDAVRLIAETFFKYRAAKA